MGPVIPDDKLMNKNEKNKKGKKGIMISGAGALRGQDNYIINLLRGNRKSMEKDDEFSKYKYQQQESILSVFIEAEKLNYQLLTPLLTFQFEHLFAFYIEQATTAKHANVFFRAIVSVVQRDGVQKLTTVESRNQFDGNDWRIIRARGNGFLTLFFHYAHKLIFLGFIMIIKNESDVRYSGFLLLRTMANILVGDSLVNKIDELKFAFESNMALWVRNNGVKISELFSKSYPAIASLLFRICIQHADNTKRAEWIATFLKPWAKVIHLKPDKDIYTIPENIMKAIKLKELQSRKYAKKLPPKPAKGDSRSNSKTHFYSYSRHSSSSMCY